jgi:hypothetical protein
VVGFLMRSLLVAVAVVETLVVAVEPAGIFT